MTSKSDFWRFRGSLPRDIPLARALVLGAGLGLALFGFAEPVFAQNKAAEEVIQISSNGHQSEFKTGVEAYRLGDYDQSFKIWLPLAEAGELSAQYNIAHLLLQGLGVEKSASDALPWLEKSAKGGLNQADTLLGVLYVSHPELPRDYFKAVTHFYQAARQNDGRAQYNLGLLYEHGLGVELNVNTAAAWFNLAAKAGHGQAIARLETFSHAPDPAAGFPAPAGMIYTSHIYPQQSGDLVARLGTNLEAPVQQQGTIEEEERTLSLNSPPPETTSGRDAPAQSDEKVAREEIILSLSPQTHIVASPTDENPDGASDALPDRTGDEPNEALLPKAEIVEIAIVVPRLKPGIPELAMTAEAVSEPDPETLQMGLPGAGVEFMPASDRSDEPRAMEPLQIAKSSAVDVPVTTSKGTQMSPAHEPGEIVSTVQKITPVAPAKEHAAAADANISADRITASRKTSVLETADLGPTPLKDVQNEIALSGVSGDIMALIAIDTDQDVLALLRPKSKPAVATEIMPPDQPAPPPPEVVETTEMAVAILAKPASDMSLQGKPLLTKQRPRNSQRSREHGAALLAYEKGDLSLAVQLWSILADKDDRVGKFWLGRMYNHGEGVPHDPIKAYSLIRSSARKGYSPALTALANIQARLSDKDLLKLEKSIPGN